MKPNLEKRLADLGALLKQKNDAYGDSHATAPRILGMLYPQGIPEKALPDALTITRVLDKLARIAADRDAFGESPWQDIAGYAVLRWHELSPPLPTPVAPREQYQGGGKLRPEDLRPRYCGEYGDSPLPVCSFCHEYDGRLLYTSGDPDNEARICGVCVTKAQNIFTEWEPSA